MNQKATQKRVRNFISLKAIMFLVLIANASFGLMAYGEAEGFLAESQPANTKGDTPDAMSERDSLWFLVTNDCIAIPMSQVGMLVAIDESKEFSVLDLNGNVLAESVLKVYFVQGEDAVTGIADIEEKGNDILKDLVNNRLTLVGAKGLVELYTVSGAKVKSVRSAKEDTTVDVSDLPAGVYVVRCGKQSFKFNKK
ncbi:MAG: T9SS type A sorting domain-containing protein [Bacteroidaceae bacterium]|nr:T9SS type A sorting domain-containing protein [Bacteroidaceae bacterium]